VFALAREDLKVELETLGVVNGTHTARAFKMPSC
jgi:hypothetical protein